MNWKENDRHSKMKIKQIFTKEEDEQLLKLVETYGQKNWRIVSMNIEGRSSRQCRERWMNYLSPNVNNGPWTKDEDELLEDLVLMNGNEWSKFSQAFDNRTATNIKNRWIYLQRINEKKRKNRKKNKNNFKQETSEDENKNSVSEYQSEEGDCVIEEIVKWDDIELDVPEGNYFLDICNL